MKELAAFPYVYDDSAVYILDLVYEVFVLLGKRSDRSNGLLSLDVAKVRLTKYLFSFSSFYSTLCLKHFFCYSVRESQV